MAQKLGIYLCAGCGIGEAIDLPKLANVASQEFGLTAKTHPYLCGPEGGIFLEKSLREEGLDGLVIAACSPRVHRDTFSFGSTIVERVNLREQVTWCHAAQDEDTQILAEDCLRMGIAKAQRTEPPEPSLEAVERRCLVVGGGITGLTAALEAAAAGYEVVLVEKKATLGGWLTHFSKLSPQHSSYRDVEEPPLETLTRGVQEHPKVKVLTTTEIEKISGQPGAFDVDLRQNGTSLHFEVGSIVLATGWQPYDATKLGHLGFGKYQDVITNLDLEKMAHQGKIQRPSDEKEAKNVVFIQCAGSRDKDHLPYCSSVCCLVSLKQALYVREQNPEANVYIFYRDIRTPGQYEDFYRRVQEEEKVFFVKGDVTSVTGEGQGSLIVEAEHTLLGEKIAVKADLVVLATGMVPSTLEGKALHLQYRQGPELPALRYGYPDSHFLCFPYETQRTAIYAAGCVRQPMGVAASIEDATGAALKAIQALEIIGRGGALHPRVGDLYYPTFHLQRCTQCKRCTEECPFGALDEDEKGTPRPNVNRCRRCGVCLGACPERLVSFKNYNVEQLSAMIKAIPMPSEEEEKVRILALICENDAYPAFDLAGISRLQYDPSLRIVPLRCLGSMNVVLIANAFSKGFDGIMLIGCKHGDDYQCHFIKGSELANRRMENVQETLTRLALEPQRVKLVSLAISDYDTIPRIVNDFVTEIRELGPNPYKGL